ncbi:MAG: hypothetical protein Q8L48_32515 [Archangium sp.]|nr:hypothetical protein [Archangium sp.]
MDNRKHRLALLLALMTPLLIWGADLVIPHTFSAGGAIRAEEMNSNFDAVRASFNAHGSGSRLKVMNLKGPDGFVQPFSYQGLPIAWDSQLQMSCMVAGGYCLPLAVVTGFSDAACTVPVAQQNSSTVGYYAQFYFRADAGAFAESSRYAYQSIYPQAPTFHRVGAAQMGTVYSSQSQTYSDGGTQTTCNPQGTQTFYPVTGTEPESTFARVVLSVE